MKLRNFVLVAALAGSALALAACGGGDDDDETTGDATATTAATRASDGATTAATTAPGSATTAPSGGSTPAPTSSASASPTTSGGGGSLTGSGADDLRALAKDLSKKTYTVTYEFEEDTASGLGGGTFILVQKPPKSSYTFGNDQESVTVIDDGVSSWTCTKSATESEGACIKSPSSGGLLSAGAFDLDQALDELESNLNATRTGDDTIAGRAAACFNIKQEGQPDSRTCFDKKDGFALQFEQTDATGAKFGLRAISASNTVDDELFKPPYPVTSLP